ncbi:uncharacterized protein PG986_005701 [Apiospora aurea]|uniref:Transmembrane protein n=1 Tax=Apiospora aurea TaxID=335848 RepID=A0ABR1QIB4_9PEZI
MVQSRAEPPLQPTPGDEPAYSVFKDVRVISPLCVLAVLVSATILGTVLYREHYKSRRERRRRQQSERRRLEGGLMAAAAVASTSGGAEQAEMTTPLLRPGVASVNYAAITPWSQLEAICEEARQRHHHHHEAHEPDENVDDVDEGEGEEEAYVYNVFALLPSPELLLLQVQMQQVQLRRYVDRTGQCRTCVRDVLLRRLEGRQRAAGTVAWRLGGRRVQRDGIGEVCEVCWEEV